MFISEEDDLLTDEVNLFSKLSNLPLFMIVPLPSNLQLLLMPVHVPLHPSDLTPIILFTTAPPVLSELHLVDFYPSSKVVDILGVLKCSFSEQLCLF